MYCDMPEMPKWIFYANFYYRISDVLLLMRVRWNPIQGGFDLVKLHS